MKRLALALAVLLVLSGVPTTVADDDGRPLADAGLDQSATVGSVVYLDGGGSVDPDGELVDYRWSITTPDGDTITPADPGAVMTRFVPDETGRYRVQLTVTDDDGQSRSDTLYVDVDPSTERQSSPTETPTETATETATATPEPTDDTSTETAPSTSIDPPNGGPGIDASSNDGTESEGTNQPPSGRLLGPDSVTTGSHVAYTIEASDPDGQIADRWWLPAEFATEHADQSELRGERRTLTVDGTPGTTAELSAVVVDDDGASSTVTKTVEITNTPPDASIEGDDTAVVNTTKAYRLTATDPDGEITSVRLAGGAEAVEPTEPMPWDGPTDSGTWQRSFRFTEVPADDGTVTFEATVRDEHGGVTTVEKSVTVVSGKVDRSANPIAQSPPEILGFDASLQEGPEGINQRQVRFSATATDEDSDRLTFEWRLGDIERLRNAAGGEPARSNVSYAFDDQDIGNGEVDVTLTVSDQNGNSRSVTKTLQLQSMGGSTIGRNHPIKVMNVRGRTVQGRYRISGDHAGQDVLLTFGDGHSRTVTLSGSSVYQFSHEYGSAGRYSIALNPFWSPDVSSTPVNVGGPTYTMWTYERKATTVHRTTAAESPGSDWTRDGIARIERDQVGVETTRTRATNHGPRLSPGEEWERAGTTIEYRSERRTTESTSHPGGDWRLSERNVDWKRVFDGWDYMTVPYRGNSRDWTSVGKVRRTVHQTETTRSADRPAGSGWSREERVGQTQVDYRIERVYNRHFAGLEWEYMGRDRYVSDYERTRRCVDRVRFYRTSFCVEYDTDYEPVYDYRYEYRVPVYDDVYEWERTVEETVYDHRYRTETYAIEAVHEYERTARVPVEYIDWERPVYETTEIYRWKTTETTWEQASSLSKPVGEVRNLERRVKECGSDRDPDEPAVCEQGGS